MTPLYCILHLQYTLRKEETENVNFVPSLFGFTGYLLVNYCALTWHVNICMTSLNNQLMSSDLTCVVGRPATAAQQFIVCLRAEHFTQEERRQQQQQQQQHKQYTQAREHIYLLHA